jgi:hypothetical protein
MRSFWGCERNGLSSLISNCAGWVSATGARDQPLFVVGWMAYGSGSEKVDVLINLGASRKPSLRLSPMA